MENITQLLSPAQVDAILAVYDTLADWYAQAADFVGNMAQSTIIEDVWI